MRFFDYIKWEIVNIFKSVKGFFYNFKRPTYAFDFFSYIFIILILLNIRYKKPLIDEWSGGALVVLIITYIWKRKRDKYSQFIGEQRKKYKEQVN